MRDLTNEEIEDYLAFAQTTRGPRLKEFSQDQASLIGDAFLHSGMMQAVTLIAADHIIELPPEQVSAEAVMLSLLVWAFQMGRECESRLLTLALKNPKQPPNPLRQIKKQPRHSGTHPLTAVTCDDPACWCHGAKP